NHFGPYMDNAMLKPFIQKILANQWDYLEHVLTNPSRILSIVEEERPDLHRHLDTPEGRAWLNQAAKDTYDELYRYVWE
ncbi:MAG: hypothetical protein ABEK12_02670, partial [Candidatus Nanohaloarchaea archaeon]